MIADGSIAIAICDRCRMKRPYTELGPDPNYPGLRVCQTQGCRDQYDPYRLPPRAPDPVSMRFPRPDAPLYVDEKFVVTQTDDLINVDTTNTPGNDKDLSP